jgi:hypothetical protein
LAVLQLLDFLFFFLLYAHPVPFQVIVNIQGWRKLTLGKSWMNFKNLKTANINHYSQGRAEIVMVMDRVIHLITEK